MTGVHGLQHVERSTVANLADDDAVGAHTEGVLDEVADRDLALALDVRRTRLESKTTWCCFSWSSAASSMVTMRSSSGMKDEMTLSNVVLPEPVPPEMTMLRRPRTHATRKSRTCTLKVPNAMRSLSVKGSVENFRMVRHRPRRGRWAG